MNNTEKEIKMVEIELDLEENTVTKLLKYARENIINDEKALINWAVNVILAEMVKKNKEEENG